MVSKREFWFRHIEAWRKGRMGQSEYARTHDLSIKSFGYYRRRYFREQQQAAPQPANTSLLPVTVIPEPVTEDTPDESAITTPGITLTSPGGFRIELSTGFNQKALKQILKMLEGA